MAVESDSMREIHQRRRDAFRQKWCKRFKDWSWYAVLAEVFLLALWPAGATLALLAGVVLTVLRFRTDRTFKFRQLPLDVPVCLFLLLSGVSILASPDRGFSFYNWYNLVGVYALTYFLVGQQVRDGQQVRQILLAIASARALRLERSSAPTDCLNSTGSKVVTLSPSRAAIIFLVTPGAHE